MKKIIEEIEEQGFSRIDNILSKEKCDLYKKFLNEDYLKYSNKYYRSSNISNHGLENKSNEKVVFNLHNKRLDYYDLFQNKEVNSILDFFLKKGSYMNQEPYALINTSARSPAPKSKGQQLHLDSNLPGTVLPLIMVVIWMLDDFTEVNGATRVIPGSHKFNTYAENNRKYPDEKIITGTQGSVLIYNASLWHGSSDKNDDSERWGVVLGYGRWFIKPSFDYMKNMPSEIFDKLNDEQKLLLGYKFNPPKDEFTRISRRSEHFDYPQYYQLP